MKIRLPRKLKKKLKKLHKFKLTFGGVEYDVHYYPYLQYDFYPTEPLMTRKRKKKLMLMGNIEF